ncbi:MAG TPA: methyl-accepting chemotaxis protein [Candidatus Acidoferrales bacterium]|nr:methyl-accepting chemotaxis protein [Candidatus Acidoferrales bacterium]
MPHSTTSPQSAAGFDPRRPADPIPPAGGAADRENGRAGGSEALEAELQVYRRMVDRVVEVTSQAAQGNLEARLLRCDDSQESTLLARSVNHLLDMTDAFLREAGAALEHASQGKFFRRVLLRGMRGTFRHKSQLINDATQKMARNAASLKQVEQLVSDSAVMAQDAVRDATDAVAVVKRLGEASTRIGDVAKSISQIAWQTKLLAFNAKIEAGRAGEAGRGFEVVAQEVKELAQQTAVATDGIAKEITAMREEVARTAGAIDTISKTIAQMQDISVTIERAVVERHNERTQGNGNPAAKEASRARS